MYQRRDLWHDCELFGGVCVPKVAPIVDTTRAAVAYFRDDAPVKYSRIKRRQRPGVNRDELDEWEPSPAPERTRERKISTGSRLQPECRGVSVARENPERANRLSLSYFHLDASVNRRKKKRKRKRDRQTS